MSIVFDVEMKDKVSGPAHSAAEGMSAASHAAEGLHGHVSVLTESWEVLEGVLEARVVEMAFEAIVDVAKELPSLVIEAVDQIERLRSAFGALEGGGEEAGDAVLGMLRDVEKEVPQSEKVLGSWTRSLQAAGVTDLGKLHESLKGIAGAEALVEGGGEKVRGMLARLNEASERGTKVKFSIAQLAGTGVTEADLLKHLGMTPRTFEAARKAGTITGTEIADAMVASINEKAAGPIEEQMAEVGTIMNKAKDSIMRLFETVDIGPFTNALKEFFSAFDQANPSGQAIRDVLVGAFNSFFSVAGRVFEALRVGFLYLIIWALEAAIFLKPIVKHFQEWFEEVHGAETLLTVLKGVGIVLGTFAAILVAIIAVNAAFYAGLIAVIGLVAYVIGLTPKIGEALGDWAYHAVETAKAFVAGLVDGIKSGVGLVVDAVRNMGKSAWNAIKATLGISSPSRLMMTVGTNVTAGMAQGIRVGTPDVASAGADMASAAVPTATERPVQAVPRPSQSSTTNAPSLTMGDVIVHVDGAHASPTAIGAAVADAVEEKFASLLNRLANMGGTAPVPA